MIWGQVDLTLFSHKSYDNGAVSRSSCFLHCAITQSSQNLIPYLDLLNWHVAKISGDQFPFGYANLIHPGTGGVVPAADILIIGTFRVHLGAVREQDHGPGTLLVPEVDSSPM
jgi:hypothetical protein